MSQHSSRHLSLAPAVKSEFLQDAAVHIGVGAMSLVVVLVAMLMGESDMREQFRLLSSSSKEHSR